MKGKITISRVQCSHEDDYICIQVIDEVSETRFVEVKLTPETFANVITGLAFQDCEFKTRDLNRIGLFREYKTEKIHRPKKYKSTDGAKVELDSILEPFEIDGWLATRDDAYNNHRWAEDYKVKVGFTRYVDAT